MRSTLILGNGLAPAAAVVWWWNGHGWWGLAVLFLVHLATLWATLWPYAQWWGPQQLDFATTGHEVWLTLDDGPDPDDTPFLLDALDDHAARATFFLIGAKAAAHPDLVREIVRRGHTLGNHTMTHPQYAFWRLGPAALAREIDEAAAVLAAVAGSAPNLFRAPAGMRNLFLHPLLRDRGLRLTGWTVRGLDGRDTDRDRIIGRVLRGARPGAILLLHEGRRDAHGRSLVRDCVPAVLSALTARGYRFVIPPNPMKFPSLSVSAALLAGAAVPGLLPARDPAAATTTLREDFEKGFDRWQPTAPENWKLTDDHGGRVLDLFDRTARTTPPHRSPFNFVLLKDHAFSDVSITAKVRTTTKAYGHRDIVVVFGYQDPARYYYVHFGEKADDHAGQVFIVNNAPRTKISTKETSGIPWREDTWHTVKVTRTAADGMIRVYFDDMDTTVMEAKDTTFGTGRIGLGSFDDTARFDDVVIEGVTPPQA